MMDLSELFQSGVASLLGLERLWPGIVEDKTHIWTIGPVSEGGRLDS
jgi:hypothetical protein